MNPTAIPRDRGLCFEELLPGLEVHSAPRLLTQADVEAFATLTGDHNPIHLDEAFAARSPFRRRIAHGLLVEAVASGLAWQTGVFRGTIVALSRIEIEFVAPVRPPVELRLRLRVLEREVEPGPRRGWVALATDVLAPEDELVLRGRWVTLVQRAPRGAN